MSEQKEWAHEVYRGVESSLKTAFTPDFAQLDEDGIRLDVRHSISQGLFAAMCSSTYTTLAERKRFLEVVCDEAAGHLLVGVNAALTQKEGSLDECIELLIHAERTGCTHGFIEYPRHLRPQSADEVYSYMRQLTDATRLPLILYGYSSPNLRALHPSGMLLDVFDRLADVPNVVGMKLTQTINPVMAVELCERLTPRLLMGPADLNLVPVLARHFPIQWVGQWVIESIQSPDKPYLVEFMRHVQQGDMDKAMPFYWRMSPAFQYVSRLQQGFLMRGSHPWAHINYYHWCVGGNGGLPRGPEGGGSGDAVLDAEGRRAIREAYREIGIAVTEAPEEEFVVGKANYEKGVRQEDLATTPLYKP